MFLQYWSFNLVELLEARLTKALDSNGTPGVFSLSGLHTLSPFVLSPVKMSASVHYNYLPWFAVWPHFPDGRPMSSLILKREWQFLNSLRADKNKQSKIILKQRNYQILLASNPTHILCSLLFPSFQHTLTPHVPYDVLIHIELPSKWLSITLKWNNPLEHSRG